MDLVKQVKFGNTGIKISPIIVGCMSYGTKEWSDWVIEDKEKVFEILKYCYDNGLRTFDTADVYSNGVSERLIGEFLRKYKIRRETVVILTKIFAPIDETLTITLGNVFNLDPVAALDLSNQQGLSRKHIIDGVAKSVERLGTYIDVLQIHRLDHDTPMEEIMRSLNDVVNSNQVRYIGASSMLATEFVELQFIAEKHGWHKFANWQTRYNLLYREDEREVIPFAKRHNIALTPWSPNARGVLCRPWGGKTTRSDSDRFSAMVHDDSDQVIVERVEQLAKQKGISMAKLSNAWVLHKGCNPIVGLSSVERAKEAIESLEVKLTEDDISFLEEMYKPKPLSVAG
ncbi:hypothetical protein RNJ44_01163 [Nakaseomyces bracarensis]|uniref:NADP-dependent oxidoreductase domain-containing protein n=1 Tax=Nakaseomyces bracarensis TaxID=273131 RepID=A0ABR4NR28_9SACH